MKRSMKTAISLAALAVTACGAPEAPTVCDRACLIDIAERYLAAVAQGDPSAAPLSDAAAFVENVTSMQPGEGLWASASGVFNDFRIYVPDSAESSIGLMAVIDRQGERGAEPVLVAVRLKVESGEIVEAEHIAGELATRLEVPRANLVAVVPEAERMPRNELAAIASAYYDGLDSSDATLVPFAADCERQENGMITAAAGLAPEVFYGVDVDGRSPPPVARDCVGQMNSRRFAYIDSIDNRRVFAVDPVQGLAMGFSHFRQSMARGPHLMIAADGTEVMWDERREPYDLPAAHIFKISGGEIHEVEAVGIFVPYGSPTGWE